MPSGPVRPWRALGSHRPEYRYLRCLQFPFSPLLSQTDSPNELCGRIDQLIENYCSSERGITGGRITPRLCRGAVCKRVLFNRLSLHPPSNRYCFLLKDTKKCTQTSGRIINTSQMTAGIDCLPSTIMFLLFTF